MEVKGFIIISTILFAIMSIGWKHDTTLNMIYKVITIIMSLYGIIVIFKLF